MDMPLFVARRIVGAVLLISTLMEERGETFIRSHVTSWFVEPELRPLAALFLNSRPQAQRYRIHQRLSTRLDAAYHRKAGDFAAIRMVRS